MEHSALAAFAAAAAIALVSPGRAAAESGSASGPVDPIEVEAFFDGVLAAQRYRHRLVGAVVAVVRDGELFFSKGYGFADLETRAEVDPATTMFRIASVSKPFTWTAVMQLVEQGKLDLDTDVNAYLSEFSIPETFARPITLTHLLTHTPGFEDQGAGLASRTADELLPLRQFLAGQVPARVREPGAFSAYSNYGSALAGYIVQEVSGTLWADYIERNILAPLDMHYSSPRQELPDHLRTHLASSYSYEGGQFVKAPFWFLHDRPAGGLSASARDMAHFMIAHLQYGRFGDRRILAEDTARRMQSVLFSHAAGVAPFLHGFYRSDWNGQVIFGHGGDTNMFHSDLSLFPEHGVGLFVSYNSDPAAAARDELVRAFVEHYFPVALPPALTPPPDFGDRKADYEGSYAPLRRNYSGWEKAGLLGGTFEISAGEDTLRLASTGGPVTQWVETEPDTFREMGSQTKLVFRRDASGAVTHLFLSTNPTTAFDRLPWFEAPGFHMRLIGLNALVSALALLAWPISAWRRRAEGTPGISRWAYVLAWTLCALNLMAFGGLMWGLSADPRTFLFETPGFVRTLLTLAPVRGALALGVAAVAAALWIRGTGRVASRMGYALVALAGLGGLWSMLHWNQLSYVLP